MRRREYLHWLSACGLGAIWGSSRGFGAQPPIEGRKKAKFKLSLAAYSYRDSLQVQADKPASMDLFGFVDECADMQLDGAELTGYYMPQPPSEDYLRQLRTYCFQLGLDVSGTATRSDFSRTAEDEHQRQEVDSVKKWIDVAWTLQAPTLRIFAGVGQENVDAEQTHRNMVAGLKEVSEYAATKGVILGLENHGGPTETAAGLLRLIRDVGSPWLAANLDTGNFRGSVDPYEQMALVAPQAVNVQIKVVVPMPDGSLQPMDYPRIFEILRRANYRGYVVLEYEEPGDVKAECRKEFEAIRRAISTSI